MSKPSKRLSWYFYTYPIAVMNARFNKLWYALYFKIHNVRCEQVPEILGRFKMINRGAVYFKSGLRFYSSFSSNPMGMNKYCSIFVQEGAILSIGKGCGFSAVSIYCTKAITIGNNLFCGGNVNLWDTDFHPIPFEQRRNNEDHLAISKPIKIGNDVFIGANSTILKGVEIGDRSVIGAGSMVTKNIPSDEIWAGNPAKFIKFLN